MLTVKNVPIPITEHGEPCPLIFFDHVQFLTAMVKIYLIGFRFPKFLYNNNQLHQIHEYQPIHYISLWQQQPLDHILHNYGSSNHSSCCWMNIILQPSGIVCGNRLYIFMNILIICTRLQSQGGRYCLAYECDLQWFFLYIHWVN